MSESAQRSLILRDHLAIDRTTMANERTFLSYVRTSVALLLTGLSALHFPYMGLETSAPAALYETAGWIFSAASGVVLVIGWRRYWLFRKQIQRAQQEGEAAF